MAGQGCIFRSILASVICVKLAPSLAWPWYSLAKAKLIQGWHITTDLSMCVTKQLAHP